MSNFYTRVANTELGTDIYPIRSDTFVIRTLLNPLRLTRTLIQLGHEPLSPTASLSPLSLLSFSSSTIYCYPNVFVYTRHLFHTYGFWPVMTCGFFSSFCFDFLTEVFYFMSHRYIVERALCAEEWLDDTEVMEKPKSRFGEGLVDRIPLSQFAAHLLNLCLLKVHEVVITQPFYVIMVRQGASIIGKEVGYSWFYQAVLSIFRDNGIMGFFSGITPRLMFELSPMIIYLCVRRMLQQNIFSSLRSWSKTVHSCIHTLSYAVINFLAYRLEVVSCVMALHGSRIPTVEAAVANSFSGWRECRRTLAMTGQLQRGYFPFWRFCPTPSFAPL